MAMMPSVLSRSDLLSGIIGALLSTACTLVVAVYLDRNNKRWALKAELRRHHVERLISANDTLRKCFYAALVQLEFHLVAIEGLEAELSTSPQRQPEIQHKREQVVIRYNSVVGQIQADARASVALLMVSTIIPTDIKTRLQSIMQRFITVFNSNSVSIKQRIQVYKDSETEVLTLLAEADELIAREISKELL